MAKTVLMRPNVVVLSAAVQGHFFSSSRSLSLLPYFQATAAKKPCYSVSSSSRRFSSTMHPPYKFDTRWNLSIRAQSTQVNDSGSIDSPLIQSMEKKIKEDLNAESVIVKDAYGDGRHVMIDVISSSFEGQSAVSRQRMVYKAIWEELQSVVHAVDQMTTRTPAEAGADK